MAKVAKRKLLRLVAFASGHGKDGDIYRFHMERVALEIAKGLKRRDARAAATHAAAKKFRCTARTVQRCVANVAAAHGEARSMADATAIDMAKAQRRIELISTVLSPVELDAMEDWTVVQAYTLAVERQQRRALEGRVRALEAEISWLNTRAAICVAESVRRRP